MKQLVLTLGASLFLLSLGCAPSDKVVVDGMESLKDGTFIAYKLEPGTYKVDVTAINDGVTVKFIGCSCRGPMPSSSMGPSGKPTSTVSVGLRSSS